MKENVLNELDHRFEDARFALSQKRYKDFNGIINDIRAIINFLQKTGVITTEEFITAVNLMSNEIDDYYWIISNESF